MYQTTLYGGHAFLRECPTVAQFIIYCILYSALWIGRWVFEGKGYDVAYSSKIGDFGLVLIIMMAAKVLKNPAIHPALWIESPIFHWVIGIGAILAGIIFYLVTRPKYGMDIWHSLVILPLFVYFIISVLPIYILYASHTRQVIALTLLLVWAGLVVYDIKSGRLDQRTWIHRTRDWWFRN